MAVFLKTPASTITGTCAFSTIRRMLQGLWMPSPEPIGAPRGRHRAAAELLQAPSRQRVVAAVDHPLEAQLDQLAGGDQGFADVRVEGLRVAEHPELDQVVAVQPFACQQAGAHRILGRVAAGGVGQQGEALLSVCYATARRRRRGGSLIKQPVWH